MTFKGLVGILSAAVVVACGNRVTEVMPIAMLPTSDDADQAYVAELARERIPSGLENEHLVSPDRKMKLELTHDQGLLGGQTGFYGVELVELESNQRRPILSLWEADSGSGVLINVRWSADSRAVRLKGSTQGYHRHGSEFRNFDILYVVNDNRYLDLCGCSSEREALHHAI